MKLQLLLILAILPMIIIPSFAEAQIIVTTDKSEYYQSDIVYLNGTVNLVDDNSALSIIVVRPDNNLVMIQQLEVSIDGAFNAEIRTDRESVSSSETYKIKLQYQTEKTEITFELLPNNIQLQKDKTEYYQTENILINGITSNVDWSGDTSVYWDVNDVIFDDTTLNNDGTFDFIIDTTLWNYDGEIKVTVNIQNYTSSIFFDYYDIPNKTSEANYDRLMIHNNTITNHDTILITHDTMLNFHDPMLYKHDDLLINQTSAIINLQQIIISLNNTVTQQQLGLGYLAQFNFTLGEQYPVIFDAQDRSKINNEFNQINDSIAQADIEINDTLPKLTQAMADGNTDKIVKYTEKLSSALATRGFYENQLNGAYLFIDVYPQP